MGPTASGKSAVGLELARRFGAEIVSVDSMQVYRGMDIGTAKPSPAERALVTHHLVDIAEPEEVFTVARFQAAGRPILGGPGRLLVVGGSGLHFRALVDPLDFPPSEAVVRAELESLDAAEAVRRLLDADPDAGDSVDLANPRRVVRALEVLALTGQTPTERSRRPEAAAVREHRALWPLAVLGMDPGPLLAERVRRRFLAMMAEGFAGEVAALAPRLGPTARQAAGYREMLRWHRGEWSLEEASRRAVEGTLSLARRQRTFFRGDPRVRWLEWHDDPGVVAARAAAIVEEAGWSS